MKLRLLTAARIHHKAGEIVEVSPAEANFLLSVRAAEVIPVRKPEAPTATEPATRGRRRKD